MKRELSKSEVEKKIKDYFSSEKIDAEKTRKIKRLAMKYKIRLGDYRKRFCKHCLSDLRNEKIRVRKTSKTIECECGHRNRFRISF